MIARPPFCDWHVSTREDDGSGSNTMCAAHMAEGVVFECPYASLAHSKIGEYPCVDGRPIQVYGRPIQQVVIGPRPKEIEW